MSLQQLILDTVTFTYPGSIHPVFSNLSAHFPVGWTGVVGANGSGKTTLLRIAAGELTPQHGTVSSGFDSVVCSQRTDSPPDAFESFLSAADTAAFKLKGQLGIKPDWNIRWNTLSHGERKRAQIAAALWQKPQILIADEPTNHIDHDTRLLLLRALENYNGIGIIVSHNRLLLDTLCRQCLFLEENPVMRPGGYSKAVQEQKREKITLIRERQKAKAAYRNLKRESDKRRMEASNADRKRSKKGLSRKDHDARFKKDVARILGKDGAAGRRLRQLAGRLQQAEQKLAEAAIPKEHALGIWLTGSQTKRDYLCYLQENTLSLGEEKELQFPVLIIKPGDLVGISGANGAGKSTLVKHIIRNLTIPAEKLVYIPQEITAGDSIQLLEDIHRLSRVERGRIMEIVSHLNSRPERLLQTSIPSPGEVRKLMLALGIMRDPYLVVMDEPTNHLDLPSITCLEAALEHCPCGLLLVSHDRHFLANTTHCEWQICLKKDGTYAVAINAGKSMEEKG